MPVGYPGRTDGTDSLFAAPSASSFPTLQLGRLLHYIFRGLLSVHSRYNLQTRQVALCDPLHRRLRRLCCLHRRSDCYRVERSSSRAGLLPAVDQCLFTAHCNGDVTPITLPTAPGKRLFRLTITARKDQVHFVGLENYEPRILGYSSE